MSKTIFKHVKKFLPLIGIILLIYLIIELDVNNIKNAFLRIELIYILVALSLTLPRIIIRNIAWQLMQKEQKIDVPFWTSLKIFLIGYFYGSFTPGYIGQLMRVPYLKEKTGEPYGKLFVNTIIETTVHTFSLYLMILLGAILVVIEQPDKTQILYLIIIWIMILSIILYYFIKKERGERFFHKLIKYLVPKNLKSDLTSFVDTFYHDFPKIRRLILPFLVSSITWIIIFTQEYIFVIALDLNIPYIYFLMLFPIANAIGFIPITFAGLGTREFAAMTIFTTLFAVPKAEIVVVTLMGFIITDVFTGLVGFFLSLTETKYKPGDIKTLKQ